MIVSRGRSKDRVFVESVPNLVLMRPVEWGRVRDQILIWLTVHMKVPGVAAIEPEASKNFQEIPFTFGRFQLLQVIYCFPMGWIPSGDITPTRILTFFIKKIILSAAVLGPAFRRRVWYSLMTLNISYLF